MSAIARRPLLVVSLAVSSLALLGFLWQRRRREEYKENCSVFEPPDFVFSDATAREVSVKLESLKRSRLENIEEEDKLPEEERSLPTADDEVVPAAEQTQDLESRTPDVPGTSVDPAASAEDLRGQSVTRESVTEVETGEKRPAVSLKETISSGFELNGIMTEKEADGPAGQEHVPDIQEALKV